MFVSCVDRLDVGCSTRGAIDNCGLGDKIDYGNGAVDEGDLGAQVLDGDFLFYFPLLSSQGNASPFQEFHQPLFLFSNFLPSAA